MMSTFWKNNDLDEEWKTTKFKQFQCTVCKYVNQNYRMKKYSNMLLFLCNLGNFMNNYNNNNDDDDNNNNNVIYIAPFTVCSRRLEESRKKVRFKFAFEPIHMIDCTDTAWQRQPIPKMRPSHRKGTIARMFFGTRDLKCNGQIGTKTVISFVDTRLKIWWQITRRTKMESYCLWLNIFVGNDIMAFNFKINLKINRTL